MSLDTPLLLALPTELLLKVLMYLPDLHSILSASSTCRRIRQIYRNSVLQIMRPLIAQTGDPHSAHSIYVRLRILGGVIIMSKLKEALSLLKDGWELLATNDYKQFLIPFGVAMARASIFKKHQKYQAVRLLRRILDHKRPFTWECTSRDPFSILLHLLSPDPLFIPLRMHLHRLSPKTYPRPSKEDLAEFRELPVAIIRPGGVDRGTDRDETLQAALLERGILFQKGMIIVKLDPTYFTEITNPSVTIGLSPLSREEIMRHDPIESITARWRQRDLEHI